MQILVGSRRVAMLFVLYFALFAKERRVRQRTSDDGAISLEMALSMPILIMVFIGIFIFAHAFYLRFTISAKVHDIARVCATRKLPSGECQAYLSQHTLEFQRYCDAWAPIATKGPLDGVKDVEAVTITVRCIYKVVGVSLFDPDRKGIGDFQVSAIVPY